VLRVAPFRFRIFPRSGFSVLNICFEWFFYGTTSVPSLCALTCTLASAKEVQLFPGLGLYSGIFAMYLQCHPNESRTATIIFYALCLLYVLSTVNVVVDLFNYIFILVSNNSICKNIIFLSVMQAYSNSLSLIDLESLARIFRNAIIQTTASSCCDFLAQCILVRINHSSCTYHPFQSLFT
jgi:hypothetical protein